MHIFRRHPFIHEASKTIFVGQYWVVCNPRARDVSIAIAPGGAKAANGRKW